MADDDVPVPFLDVLGEPVERAAHLLAAGREGVAHDVDDVPAVLSAVAGVPVADGVRDDRGCGRVGHQADPHPAPRAVVPHWPRFVTRLIATAITPVPNP